MTNNHSTNNRIYYSREAEELANRHRRIRSLTILGLGAGLGAAAALLLTPNDGERARELVAEALEDGFSRGKDTAGDALKQLEHEYPDLKDRVVKILNGIMP